MRFIGVLLAVLLATVSSAQAQSVPNAMPPANLLQLFKCPADIQSANCWNAAPAPQDFQSLVNTLAGRTAISVTDYQSIKGSPVCNGSGDDTAAIQAADSAALAVNGSIWFPPGGLCIVNGTVGNTVLQADVWWLTFGQPATIWFKTDIGVGARWNVVSSGFPVADGTPAGLVLNTNAISNLHLIGPNCTPNGEGEAFCPYTVGSAPAQMDGLRLGLTANGAFNPMFVDHLWVEGFYNGIVINTQYGHWHITDSKADDSFYNIYLVHTGGDAIMREDDFTGPAFASIACAWNNQCLEGNWTLEETHTGFGPYGIYQEPSIGAPTFGGFADGGVLKHDGFECIGNTAIKSAQAQNGEQLWSGNIILKSGGFTWASNTTYCNNAATYQLSTATQTKTCTVNAANNPSSGTYSGSGLLLCSASPVFKFGQQVTSGTGIPAHTFVLSDDGAGNVRISLPVNGTNGSESVSMAYDADYAIDLGDLEGVFDIDMGAAPADVFNGGGAFEPGTSGAIIHTQACSSVSGQSGSRVILRYTDKEGPPKANSQGPLYICDSDPFSSGSQAISRVITSAAFNPGYFVDLLQITVASGQTVGTLSLNVSQMAAGGTVIGIQPVCQSATDASHAVVQSAMTQGTGATQNEATLMVTLGSAAPTGGELVNCHLPAVF